MHRKTKDHSSAAQARMKLRSMQAVTCRLWIL